MKKIGVEEHFLTPKYIEYMHNRKDYPRREITVENGKKIEREWITPAVSRDMGDGSDDRISSLGEVRLRDMDEAGIDMHILSISFPSVEFFSAEDAVAISKVVNDEIADAVNKYPDRFAGLAVIAPQDPDNAAKELERAVTKLGLKGTIVTGHIQGEYLDDQKYWDILAVAEKLDVPVYIHPKIPREDMIKPYLAYPGLEKAMLGFTADASLHAMRLILSGVFDKYPGLKIILGHMGEAIPFWLWRMDSRLESQKNFDAEAKKQYDALHRTLSQYFKENFYVTTSGMFWHPALKFVNSVLGADRILFATDYPYESGKEAAEFMETAPLSTEEKEKIAHLNAEKLFKL